MSPPLVDGLGAATFYVSCDTGSDRNSGMSELSAWQSASMVSQSQFTDGDKVLFKRGCVWEDVSLKITRSLEFGAYGDGKLPPHLIGAARARSWSRLGTANVFFTLAEIEPSSAVGKDILVVHDNRHSRFYQKVSTMGSLDSSGKFYYDLPGRTLYLSPLEDTDLRHDVYFGSKPHVMEFQQTNLDRIVIDGLQLSFANEYSIGFWYQGSGTKNGSLRIANCTFIGNAYQAIHVGGTNTFREIEIVNNTISANGNEGIYIGWVKGKEIYKGEVVAQRLRISGNVIGGQGFGWRAEGPESAANGEGIDVKKGIAEGIIDHNMVFDVIAGYGIGTQSSNVIIEYNTVRDVHMWGGTQESSVAAIFVDPYDNKGTTIVRNNTMTTPSTHGIVIRGDADLKPKLEIYENVISVNEPYSSFAFTSQNITNTVIRNNRTRGGRAGLAVLKPCCPPVAVEFHNNTIGEVSTPLVTAQDLSAGVRIYSNRFCLKGQDADQKKALPNNTFFSNCDTAVGAPQNLQIQ